MASGPLTQTLATVVGLVATPFYLIAVLFCVIYRLGLHVFFSFAQPGYSGLLNFLEGFFDLESGANLSIINIVCHVKLTKINSGKELKDVIVKLFEKSLKDERLVRLKCKRSQRFGLRFWEVVGCDLDKQICLFEASNKSEIQNYLSNISNRPLVDDRLWEVHVGKTAVNGSHCVIIRAHHTLGDGYAIRQCLVEAQPNYKAHKSKPKPVGLMKMCRMVIAASKDVILAIVLTPTLCLSQYLDSVDRNSLRAEEMSGEKVLRWCEGDFRKVKGIQKAKKVTCTEILMAALSKSLDDLFKSRGEFVGQVTVSFPFRRSQETTGLLNEFIPVGLKVPVNTDNRLERVARACRSLQDKPDYVINYFFPRYAAMIFPAKLPNWTYRCTESTSVFSNFPGPKEKAVFHEFETEGFLFFVPNLPDNNGLGVVISTYCDQVVYSVIMDRAVIQHDDDPQRIAESMAKYIDDTYQSL